MTIKYPGKQISYEEAKERLTRIGEAYCWEQMKVIPDELRTKVMKMFVIVSTSAECLFYEVGKINSAMIILDTEHYIPIEINEQILFDTTMMYSFMLTNTNYKDAINMLVRVTDLVRQLGRYNNDISIGLHGNYSFLDDNSLNIIVNRLGNKESVE